MSSRALAAAIRALVPTGVANRYDGQAPGGAPLPRVVLNQSVPDIDSRSEAGTPQGQVGSVLVTMAASTEDAVLALADTVLAAFEGARVEVAGWLTSPLRRVGPVRTFPDLDVATSATNTYPMVGKATFEYTVTRTA